MTSDQTPPPPVGANPQSVSPAEHSVANLAGVDRVAGVEVGSPAKSGPNKVLLLGVAFGVALLIAAALLFIGLGKL